MEEIIRISKTYKGIFVVTAFLWALGFLLAVLLVPGPVWGRVGVAIGLLLLELVWLRKSFVMVGRERNPRGEMVPVAVLLTAFGRPTRALEPGLHFRFWPVEKLYPFPTGTYVITYLFPKVYTKAEHEQSSQELSVSATLYFRWPTPAGEGTYHFPRPVGMVVGRKGKERTPLGRSRNWLEADASRLLRKAYFAFPYDPMKITGDELREFFRGSMAKAVEAVCSQFSYGGVLEKKQEIEHEINMLILAQEGDPFYDMGIPWECTEVAMTVDLPEDTVKGLRQRELAYHAAQAATQEKGAIAARLEGYMSQPETSPLLAQLLASGGITGGGMDLGQFRDFALAQALIGGGSRQQVGFQEIRRALNRLSPGQIRGLRQELGRIEQNRGSVSSVSK